jgi:3-oxoacyl-[acyl-carrier protein] reductase
MDLGLRGLCAVVTGASGGIGRALMEAFALEGANVVALGRSRFDELARYVEGRAWSDRALCLRADVTSPAELQAAFGEARQVFGRADVCVANAGVWPREHRLLHEASEERIRGTLETNLLGALWTARAFLASLVVSGPREDGLGASLCLVGSTAGRFGERGHAEYSVSKAGLYGLIRSLKNEVVQLDPYARVNLVEPGWTVTHMVREELEREGAIREVARTMPLRQLARAADIARAVAFLSSPLAARHVTGEVLTVAGGMEGRTLWRDGEIDEAEVRRRLRDA